MRWVLWWVLLVEIIDCVPDWFVFVREFRKERKEGKKKREIVNVLPVL